MTDKEKRMMQWLANGNRGSSSNTMFEVITGIKCQDYDYQDHPYDQGDFGRCKKLIDLIPELKDGFEKLSKLSKAWKNIIANWDKLCELYDSKDKVFFTFLEKLRTNA